MGTLVLDRPVRVGDRLSRSFPDARQNPGTGEWTVEPDPERAWEVAAIEPTDGDGRRAVVRGYRGEKRPIMQGRLILEPS